MRKSSLIKAIACFTAATTAITGISSINMMNGMSIVVEAAEDESETLTGTAWWTGSQKGKDYTLTGDGKVVLYVEAEKLVDGYGAFNVELQSTKSNGTGHGYFMTTGSDRNAWLAEDAMEVGKIEGIEPEGPTRASTLTEGHIYKITITRTGQDFIVEYYDDTIKEEYCVFTLKGSNFPTEDVNVHVIAQIGTYKVIQEIQNTPEEPTEPEKPTESETLTGTAWWEGSQKGKDYTLTGDGKVVLYVEAEKLIDDYGAFSVELQSTKSSDAGHGYFMTTGSDKNAWTAEDAAGAGKIEGIEPEGPTRASTLTEGHIYKITITRTGQDFIVEYYDDTTKEEYCVFTLKGSNFPTEDVNVHVIAQIGTYKVTQKIEQPIEPDKPTPKPPTTGGGITPKPPTTGGGITPEPPTTGGAITNKYTVITEATTEKKEIVTDGWWKEFSDYYQLTGDFNVTFNITNKGGEKAWNNPVTVFTTAAEREDKENYKEYAVIRSDSWGWGGGDNLTSDGNAITYVNDWAEPDILVAAMKDATITKNIVRSGNEFTMKDTIVSADGKTFTSTTKFTTAADKTMNIFLTTDTASMTINSYSGNTSSGNNTPNNPSGGNTNQGGSSSGGSSSNTNTSVKPDDKKPTTDDDKKPSTDNDNNKPTTDNNKPSTDNDSNKQPSTDNDNNTSKPDKKTSKKVNKGKKVNDSSSKASYKVTTGGNSSKATVEYEKPTGKAAKANTIVIPNTIKVNGVTCKVTSIKANAFKNNKSLKKLTISKNIKKIGKQAFYNCKSIKTITIKTKKLTVKNIGKNAFKGISFKATIKVPKGKIKAYKKLFEQKGLSSNVKVVAL